MMGGVLFVKRYYLLNDPKSTSTAEIVRLADIIWNTTHFDQLLCSGTGSDSKVDPNGTIIPMIQVG